MPNYLDSIADKRHEQSEEAYKNQSLEAFNGLSADIRSLLESLEKTGTKTLDKDFVSAVKSLTDVAQKLEDIKITSDEDIKNALLAFAQVLAQMDTRPVVNLPAPRVEVNEREIDFKPLIEKLNRPIKLPNTLADYKAQDINNDDPNIQYVGFVNPKGAWYIIENNELDNSLRYKFGKSDYTEAWQKPAKHRYLLLNEAINEVQA